MDEKFDFKELLSFKIMLFPKIATVCYILLVAISVLSGFVMFVRGIAAEWGGGGMIISGLATMIIAPLLIRLWFEFCLVLFMIYDRLDDIRGELTKSEIKKGHNT
jgi:hypothetical protein